MILSFIFNESRAQKEKKKWLIHEFGFAIPFCGMHNYYNEPTKVKSLPGISAGYFISRNNDKKLKLLLGVQYENIGYSVYPLEEDHSYFAHNWLSGGGTIVNYSYTYNLRRRIDYFNLLGGICFSTKSLEFKLMAGTPIYYLVRERRIYENREPWLSSYYREMFEEITSTFQITYYLKNDNKIKTGFMFHSSGYLWDRNFSLGIGMVVKL